MDTGLRKRSGGEGVCATALPDSSDGLTPLIHTAFVKSRFHRNVFSTDDGERSVWCECLQYLCYSPV